MAVQIVCADKPGGNLHNSHEAITDYGWIEDGTQKKGIWPRQKMVDWVKGGGVAYVEYPDVICKVLKSPHGTEYLRTKKDGVLRNDLVNLRTCRR